MQRPPTKKKRLIKKDEPSAFYESDSHDTQTDRKVSFDTTQETPTPQLQESSISVPPTQESSDITPPDLESSIVAPPLGESSIATPPPILTSPFNGNSTATPPPIDTFTTKQTPMSSAPDSMEETNENNSKKHEPRLVMKKMVLNDFKSYAGRQVIGPFHKV